MKFSNLALSLLVVMGTGCTSVRTTPPVSLSEMPNCFDTNYDKERDLFTIRNDAGNPVNQQCLLTVGPRGGGASESSLPAGRYRVYLSSGGGGGAGGTLQSFLRGGGGGGGGGAGAAQMEATIDLTEGIYKLTIGAGGPGGLVCLPNLGFGGGPGWLGSPSNMVRVATGELVVGTPGADRYVRPTLGQNVKMSGKPTGHGGSGPGQASGGSGTSAATTTMQAATVEATPGASALKSGAMDAGGGIGTASVAGGATGTTSAADKTPGVGGGGGAASTGQGGRGGGESPGQKENPPERGSLGSGGGGGEGSLSECDPGARGGHGFIAFRLI